MAKRNIFRRVAAVLALGMCMRGLAGCGSEKGSVGKTEIEVVSYKPEAVKAFEKIEKRFNETHDDIPLTISSPNEAMTILKTRFIREDYPDIIAIGGDINSSNFLIAIGVDINYSNFLDAYLFVAISDLDEVQTVKQAYLDMDKELEFIPKDGTYALPYAANAAGILYNKDLFEENGWKVPTTWQEFTTLCDEIKQSGTLPLYLGFKDTWSCLAPWNALAVGLTDSDTFKLAVGLTDSDTCNQVNMGNTTFSDTYGPVAEKMRALLDYAEKNPYAYGYNDACTAFARGEAAMYPIGSYAIPQIKSVNPDMNIGSFTFPANDNESDNVLNSGIDLQFSVMKACKNKEAAYEVLKYLYEDETIQIYLDEQGGIACKDGDFAIPETLEDMRPYIENNRMADYQDHHYPSEMSVDAMIQTFLLDTSDNAAIPETLEDMRPYIENNRMADYQDHHYPSEMSVDAMIQTFLLDTSDNAQEKFLKKFDSDWKRYNRDLIRKDYQKEQGDAQ